MAREDFAQLARRYGEDGTREDGGNLGWFRRGSMVRDFENVAFSMRAGEVRGPVLTEAGWHIIKVERVRGGEIQARHIVIRPERTEADAVRSRARADTVAERLRAGEDAAALARQYGDPDEQVRENNADVERVQGYIGVDLSTTEPGSVIGPIPRGGDDVADEFIVLRLVSRQEARPWSLDDPEAREEIRSRIEFQKLIEELIADLRRDTYIEIRS
jgi:peptidyl-prolyl cis-trans isomerase SurA